MPTHPEIRGFENFPTEFGVRYAPLRAIADTPVLPTQLLRQQRAESEIRAILGMTVKNIDTDGEMSVYATAGHNGVLVLELELGCDAGHRGIRVSDVIVGWGNSEIHRMEDLENLSFREEIPIAVLRRQQRVIL